MANKLEAANIYHEAAVFQLEDALKILEIISPQPKSSVLDMGCGTGRLSKVISKKVGSGGKVVGVDPDEERINIAAAEEKYHNNLQFMVGSDQTFPKDQYDVIVSTDVIHWIKDKEATFQRVYDNLKPGGKFGFTTLHKIGGVPDLLIEISRLCGPETCDIVMNSVYYESDQYYNDLAAVTGLNVTYCDVHDKVCNFPSLDAFIDFYYAVYYGRFDRTNPALNELKKKYEGQIVTMVVKRLMIILTKPIN